MALSAGPADGASVGSRRLELRRALRLVSNGLLAYGLIGIGIGIIGLVIGLSLWAQIGSVRADVGAVTTALDSSARALEDASSSARTMSTSLTDTAPALERASASVNTLVPTLRALATETSAIDILGQRPLAAASTLFGQTADELEALGPSLTTAATNLRTNSTSLATLSTSLGQLSTDMRSIQTQLADGGLTATIQGAVTYLGLAVVALAVWMVVPAIAALGFGWWLRQRIGLAVRTAPPVAP